MRGFHDVSPPLPPVVTNMSTTVDPKWFNLLNCRQSEPTRDKDVVMAESFPTTGGSSSTNMSKTNWIWFL